MAPTRSILPAAMEDLGWELGSSSMDGLLTFHAAIEEVGCSVVMWMLFDEIGELASWSIYKLAIVSGRENPQVVQKFEDQPALDLFVLPNPRQVFRLLGRAAEAGLGDILVETT